MMDRATLAMALLGMMGLIPVFSGQVLQRTGPAAKAAAVAPGAAYLLLSALCLLYRTATIGGVGGFPKADFFVARACACAGLIAVETLVGSVLEIYGCGCKAKDSRLLYESRLVGLLGQPEDHDHGGARAGLSIWVQGFGDVVLSFSGRGAAWLFWRKWAI